MEFQTIIQTIVTAVVRQVNDIPGSCLDDKPSGTQWSGKEMLGHLIDSAFNNHQRIVRAVGQSDLVFQGYDQEEWVRRNNYQQRDVCELLCLWKLANDHIISAINALPKGFIHKEFKKHNLHCISMNPLPASGWATLSYLVWDYIQHMEGHLIQIIPGYQRVNVPFEATLVNSITHVTRQVPWVAFR